MEGALLNSTRLGGQVLWANVSSVPCRWAQGQGRLRARGGGCRQPEPQPTAAPTCALRARCGTPALQEGRRRRLLHAALLIPLCHHRHPRLSTGANSKQFGGSCFFEVWPAAAPSAGTQRPALRRAAPPARADCCTGPPFAAPCFPFVSRSSETTTFGRCTACSPRTLHPSTFWMQVGGHSRI